MSAAQEKVAADVTPIQPKSTAPHVYQAISAVMAELAKVGIAKARDNTQQHYKFRGIDDVYNALSGILSRHGLMLLPTVEDHRQVERVTANGKPIFYSTVRVRYTLLSSIDGTSVDAVTYGEAMDSADKSTNKAMSAAFKYAAMQIFCIPTEGDNDADATTHEVSALMPDSALETLCQRVMSHGGDPEAWMAAMAGKYPDGIPMAHYDGLAQQIDRTAAKRAVEPAS